MRKRVQRFIAVIVASVMSFSTLSGAIDISAQTIQRGDESIEYEIYPVPHEMNYFSGDFQVGKDVNVIYESEIDIYTKNRVEEILSSKDISSTISDEVVEGKTNILVGINNSGEIVDNYFSNNVTHDESFFENIDSHIVYVNDGIVGVLGKDVDSTFYGITSLKHVFNQLRDGNIRNFRINDYADVKYRGFIEGYYGNPWSNDDRVELMKYGGDYKMNQYIFAPKDDPYHNSRWRELYPEDKLEDIRRLAQVGNETKNRYVYALHTFMYNPIRFNTEENYQEDLQIIKNKFSQLLEVGVRQFGILADDAGVPAEGPSSYVKLLNDLTIWLEEQQKTYTDLKKDLIFCPNDYMGNGSSTQLKEVNKAGDKVSIVVTGGRIWGEVSQSFATNFKDNITSEGYEGRAPYMWINWPCSDNSKQHLIMGGNDTFLHPDVTPGSVEGIVLNPMQQAEANKSALFANADYSWNIWETRDEADKNWEASFKYMDHGTAEDTDASKALREISKHMINQNMDSRVTALQESIELAPKLSNYKKKVENGTNTIADAEELIEEFIKLKESAAYYKENPGNDRTRDQIVYWLNCWEDTMNAAIGYLNATIAIEGGNNDEIWTEYSNAQAAFEKSKTYTFWYVDHYEKAEVGVQHIVPFIEFMGQEIGNVVSSIIDPSKVNATYITNRTDKATGDIKNVLDSNPYTEIVYKTPNSISEGTYVGIKYSNTIKLKDIQFLLGAAANSNDTMAEGKIQYTVDGREWIDLDEQVYTNPKDVKVGGLDLEVKGVRFMATKDKANTWFGVKDIIVNKEETTEAPDNNPINYTLIRTSDWGIYSGSEENLFDGNDSSMVWYRTHTGDKTKVGDYIGVDLGEIISVGDVRFVVGAGDSDKWTNYKLEYSIDNANWTTYKEYTSTGNKDVVSENLNGIEARYVRITNMQELNKWVKFSEIKIERFKETSEGDTKNIYTNTEVEIKSTSTEELTKLLAKDNITLNDGEYIGVKLNRIKDIKNINVNISDMAGLTLESSMNGVEWDVVDNVNLKDARYIRVIADRTTTFNLVEFEVESDEVYPPTLKNSYVATFDDVDGAIAFDGNFNTSVKFNGAPSLGSTIVYDLGQRININNLKYAILDTEVDYIRDAKIQLSLDGESWTDAIVIGDGVSNGSGDFNSKPGDNGYKHGSISNGIIPISHSYIEGENLDIDARYLRILFTADNAGRWAVINEILINNGEYIPTVNDPTFVSDPIELKGFEPSNLRDGRLTTAYKPNTNDGQIKSGSLTYRLSENTNIKKINIVQNSSIISDAKVLVRIGYDENGNDIWHDIGILNKSLTEILNQNFENIFEIKIEWENTAPIIYEIITINEYEKPNKDELQSKYNELIQLNGEGYTEDSFKVLQDALENAKTVLDNNNSLQKDIDNALFMLIESEKGLVVIEVDISELQELINSCNYIENKYTVSSWVLYNNALTTAIDILADLEGKEQEEVNIAKSNLEESIAGLLERATFTRHLEIAIETANEVTEEELDKIIPMVKEKFLEERTKAIDILEKYNNNDATQEEVDNAFDNLNEIMEFLSFYKGDRSKLIELVSKINELNDEEFIKKTWDNMIIKLDKANRVIADENALEDEVKEAYEELMKAFLGLRLKPSKEKLEELINKTEALEEEKYTEASWGVLKVALKEAKVVMNNENATEEEVTNSVNSLIAAIDNLEEKIDKSSLGEAIDRVSTLDKDKYTPSTWTTFEKALNKAIEVFSDENVTQDEVDEAVIILIKAESELRIRADKSRLEKLINEAKEIELNKYTESSIDKFIVALGNAIDVLNDTNAIEEIVDEAIKKLELSISELELKLNNDNNNDNNNDKDGENNKDNKPEGSLSIDTNNDENINESGSNKLPNTGGVVSSTVIVVIAIIMISSGTIFLIKKNRNN